MYSLAVAGVMLPPYLLEGGLHGRLLLVCLVGLMVEKLAGLCF
jgi:hypothetical protein